MKNNLVNAKDELLSFLDNISFLNNRELKCFVIHCASVDKDEDDDIVVVDLPVSHTEDDLEKALDALDVDYQTGSLPRITGTIWFKDGSWATRREYDGSEWWHLNVLPKIPGFLL